MLMPKETILDHFQLLAIQTILSEIRLSLPPLCNENWIKAKFAFATSPQPGLLLQFTLVTAAFKFAYQEVLCLYLVCHQWEQVGKCRNAMSTLQEYLVEYVPTVEYMPTMEYLVCMKSTKRVVASTPAGAKFPPFLSRALTDA